MAEAFDIHTESFKIRASEAGTDGTATLPALCSLLQETAGNNALDLNFDISQLQEKDLTWVLHRMHIKIHKYPAWREEIQIKTWPSAGDALRTYRDYKVMDKNGEELGVCLSYWMMLNMKTRRPVRIPKELLELRLSSPGHTLKVKTNKILPPGNPTAEKSFRVRKADLDMNNHLNNARYVDWLIETLPNQNFVTELDIVFLRESYYDELITSQTEIISDTFSKHQLLNKKGTAIALAEIHRT